MNTKNLTIMDIAKTAGVSKTTVSRYLNGKYEYMSAETRERIRTVIELTDYHPNRIAQSLKSQKSLLIALVIADIESPFSSALIKSIGNALLPFGYNIIVANSDNQYENEQRNIQSLLDQQVDGLIVNTVRAFNPELIRLANNGFPVVLLDRFVNDYKFDIAYLDNHKPISDIVRHLKEEGFSDLHLFTQECEDVSPRQQRKEAFQKCLTEYGVLNPQENIHVLKMENKEPVCDAIQSILQKAVSSAPPAILCTNGMSLVYTMSAVRSLQLSLPTDLGICGFDDWGWTANANLTGMIDVGLTTLTPSVHHLGEVTAKLLLDRLNDPKSAKQEISIPAPLIIRNSTKLR